MEFMVLKIIEYKVFAIPGFYCFYHLDVQNLKLRLLIFSKVKFLNIKACVRMKVISLRFVFTIFTPSIPAKFLKSARDSNNKYLYKMGLHWLKCLNLILEQNGTLEIFDKFPLLLCFFWGWWVSVQKYSLP